MEETIKSLAKAIRAKCLECSGGSSSEVADCELRDCALYPYRFDRQLLFSTMGKFAGMEASNPLKNKKKSMKKKGAGDSRMLSLFDLQL